MPYPRFFALLLLALAAPPLCAEVELNGAWIRALPPTQPVTAAYVAVTNRGGRAVSITGAAVEGAGRVEIHSSREVDGLVRMTQLATLVIAPGETLALEPGGTHLMLFELASMPRPGESRELCLRLADSGELCTEAAVRKRSASAAQAHHNHH